MGASGFLKKVVKSLAVWNTKGIKQHMHRTSRTRNYSIDALSYINLQNHHLIPATKFFFYSCETQRNGLSTMARSCINLESRVSIHHTERDWSPRTNPINLDTHQHDLFYLEKTTKIWALIRVECWEEEPKYLLCCICFFPSFHRPAPSNWWLALLCTARRWCAIGHGLQ